MQSKPNPLFVAVTREWTLEEKQAECLRLCGPSPSRQSHSLLCPVLHEQWKQTDRMKKAA